MVLNRTRERERQREPAPRTRHEPRVVSAGNCALLVRVRSHAPAPLTHALPSLSAIHSVRSDYLFKVRLCCAVLMRTDGATQTALCEALKHTRALTLPGFCLTHLAAAAHWGLWRGQVLSAAEVCGE